MAGATSCATRCKRKIKRRDAGDGGREDSAFHMAQRPAVKLLPAEGKIFTVNPGGSSAATLKIKTHGPTSVRASLIGLPASCTWCGRILRGVRNGLSRAPEHTLPFEGGEAASGAESLHGGGNPAASACSRRACVTRRPRCHRMAIALRPRRPSCIQRPSIKKPWVATGVSAGTIVISAMIDLRSTTAVLIIGLGKVVAFFEGAESFSTR